MNLAMFPLFTQIDEYVTFERSGLKLTACMCVNKCKGSQWTILTMVVMCGQWAVGPGAVESQRIRSSSHWQLGAPRASRMFFPGA